MKPSLIGPLTALLTFSPIFAADTCPGANVNWHEYTAAGHEFSILYPASAPPEASPEKQSGLVSRTIFRFEQPFGDGDNKGSLRFSVQVSVWENPGQLSPEAWARKTTDPKSVLASVPRMLGGTSAWSLRKTNLMAAVESLFAGKADRMYEVTYTDIATDDSMMTQASVSCWKRVLGKMAGSFTFLSTEPGR